MQNFSSKPLFTATLQAVVLPSVFHDWQRKVYLLLMVFLLIIIFSSNAFAAVDGFVARSDEGYYHQYCYSELLDSYAKKILGQSDGLYDDYTAKTPVALYTNGSGYIDYSDLLDQYAIALKNSGSFNLEQYLQNGKALQAKMPERLLMVSIATGSIVREEKALDGENGEDKRDENKQEQDNNPEPDQNPEPEEEPKPDPEPESESEEDLDALFTLIEDAAKITEANAIKWAKSKNAHQRFIDIVSLYWEYGEKSGIRPEVLYAQSAYETGYGRFGGQVPPEYNNWAGIKTAAASGDEPEDHEQFDTPEDGVRAHFNHMSAYVGLEPIGEPHGRYHVVARLSWAGTVEKIEDLSGKWAPSSTYHVRIVNMLKEMQD